LACASRRIGDRYEKDGSENEFFQRGDTMSELIEIRRTQDIRGQLLATVCTGALIVLLSGARARAAEDDRPTVWIELGGQLEHLQGSQQVFAPSFLVNHIDAPYNAQSPLDLQRSPNYGFGGEGKISFEPEDSGWIFSAAVRYGRSNGKRHVHQQTSTQLPQHNGHIGTPKYLKFYRPVTRFDDTTADHAETHTILDFMAGKDVGLGMLGRGSTSTFNFGVRFAQFSTKSDTVLRSFPDPHYGAGFKYAYQAHHHSYYGHIESQRTFRGVGPSVSWEGSVPFIGNPERGNVTFDWGANAALLFGRNKVDGSHRTTARYFMGSPYALPPPPTQHSSNAALLNRARTLIVPNAGGFAGLSVRYPNAKVSLGYRADFFFGAMDGGIDSRKSVTPGFYGPFATVSVGLGG
jgi:hypothetical protein